MKVQPINFTGMKNIGYAKVYSDEENIYNSRTILNMQLTDNKNKDLSEYKSLVAKYPEIRNKFGDDFVNIEMTIRAMNQQGYTAVIPKINGIPLYSLESDKANNIFIYMQNLVERLTHFKEKDFKVDKNYCKSDNAQMGLVYDEYIDDYLDGSSGRLKILDGTGLTEKFDYYLNDENVVLNKGEYKKLIDSMNGVVEVMHYPAYVQEGVTYIDGLIKHFVNIRNNRYKS